MNEDARSPSRDDITLDILSILQVLRRRLLLIGLVAAVFVIATALYSLRLTPIYSATSQVLFDPLVRQPFDDPNRPSRTSAGTEAIDSQISVIHADTVLRPVARDNKLSEDPYFGEGAPGLMSQLQSLFGGSQAKDPGTLEAQETAAVKALSGATTVKRVGQTFVINISVESPSPVQAAVLANAIAESYLADQRRQISTASDQTAAQIDDRLVDLRERLRQAESDIQKFKADNKLQSSNEGLLLTEQELSGVNLRLIDARAALSQATAKYDEIQRVLDNGVDAEAIGDVVNSGTISSLRQQYAQAARNEAQLLAELLPSHPSVIRARSQLERLRTLIRDEVKRIAESTRIDLQVSQEQVAKLERQLDSTRGLSNADETASIKLRELETEAQATRQLYESALSRAKEISQLEQVVLPNARIISPAVPPDSPIFPKKKIMVILAGILGLMVGTILAVGGEALRIAKKHLLPDLSAYATPVSAMPVSTSPAPSQLARPDATSAAPASHRSGRRSLLRAAQMVRPGLKLVSQLPWLPLDGEIDDPRALNTDAISMVQDAIDQYYLGRSGPNRRFGESIDQVLDELDSHTSHQSSRIVFFTSPSLGQGQTITALALALGGAHRDLRVLLADGEPKQRMLSHDLSLDEGAFGGPLRDRVVSFDELGIDFVSLVSGLPKYKHHRMSVRQAFEFADVARDFDLVIVDGVALPQLTDDDPLAALATDFLVTVSEREESQISMPILSRDLLTIADGRPAGLVRTMTGMSEPTGSTRPTGRKYG